MGALVLAGTCLLLLGFDNTDLKTTDLLEEQPGMFQELAMVAVKCKSHGWCWRRNGQPQFAKPMRAPLIGRGGIPPLHIPRRIKRPSTGLHGKFFGGGGGRRGRYAPGVIATNGRKFQGIGGKCGGNFVWCAATLRCTPRWSCGRGTRRTSGNIKRPDAGKRFFGGRPAVRKAPPMMGGGGRGIPPLRAVKRPSTGLDGKWFGGNGGRRRPPVNRIGMGTDGRKFQGIGKANLLAKLTGKCSNRSFPYCAATKTCSPRWSCAKAG